MNLIINNRSKVTAHIESVLKLASVTPGMGVSMYYKAEDNNEFNCHAWSHGTISNNIDFVKGRLVKELEVQTHRGSKDIQLLIVNEDNSTRALVNHLLDIDEEVRVSNGLRNSKVSSNPDFILSVEVARDLDNHSKSYNSVREIANREDKFFIDKHRIKDDVKVYNVVAVTELFKHI